MGGGSGEGLMIGSTDEGSKAMWAEAGCRLWKSRSGLVEMLWGSWGERRYCPALAGGPERTWRAFFFFLKFMYLF